jgi:hypothetical protein
MQRHSCRRKHQPGLLQRKNPRMPSLSLRQPGSRKAIGKPFFVIGKKLFYFVIDIRHVC